MSGNDSVGGEKSRGLKIVPTVCRLSPTGKEERDLGQKMTMRKHKGDEQDNQD